MKTLLVIGILLILTGTMSASTTGISGAWMVQSGLIFLFGALAIFAKQKSWGKEIFPLAVILMIGLFMWGFSNSMWHAHPLGAIISIVGGGWVIYRITRDKEYDTRNIHAPLIQEFSQKLLPNVKQHIKWLSVPLGILLALWLSKSLLIAFIVGFGAVSFLDKQLIKEEGLNRVVILLILYTAGFYFFLVGTYKLTSPYNGIFYNMGDLFFDIKAEEFLWRITPQGL